MVRDFRFAFRSLLRTPIFTATALLILALSLGATTAVFSLLHALVLRPLPVPKPHQLVQVGDRDALGRDADLTWRQYRELMARQRVFSTVITSLAQGVLTLESERGAIRGAVTGVSGNFYRELGATPIIGRLIEPSDVNESAMVGAPVTVLGFDFWQRHYGGDPSVLGRSIKADGVPLTIVGVAPEGFLGLGITVDHDLAVPITVVPKLLRNEASMIDGTSRWVATTGRLAPGESFESARAQITAMWPAIREAAMPTRFLNTQRDDYLARQVNVVAGAYGLERGLRGRYTNALYALLGIAVLVLIIAAANLCSLVYARAESRRHELAVRLAIGSSRLRLVKDFAAEGLLLGIGSAIGGVLLADSVSRGIAAFLLQDYTVRTSLDVSPDLSVMAVAFVVSVVEAVAVTTVAAWIVSRRGLRDLAPGGTRTVARASRLGHALVGAQVAVSIVMLTHASLLVRSVYDITSVNAGLTSETVIVGYPSPRIDAYRDLDPLVYYRQALERVAAVPGVKAAGFSTFKPEGGALPWDPVGLAGTRRGEGDVNAESPQVSPGFFAALGLTIIRGRDFSYSDTERSPKVAVISQQLERQLFGEGRGLGQRIRVTARPEWQNVEVVGIVNDARVFDVRRGNVSIAYTAAVQSGPAAHWKCLVARAPTSSTQDIRVALESLGVELMPRTQTLAYARGRTILQERLMAWLGGAFGALALVLVSAGIYGLLSYSLSLRRKEIGIRLALGADAARVGRSVLADGLTVAGMGVGLGLVAALATVRLLASVLVTTSPYDPAALTIACATLLAVTTLASLAPAVRAARVEPLVELRRD